MLRRRDYIPIILLLPMTACTVSALPETADGIVTNYTSCALNPDQGQGSLHGQWANLPVPLVFDNDFYVTDSGAALPSLRASVQTWDVWAAIKGYSAAYSLKNDGTGVTAGEPIPELTDCAQASYTSSLPGVVGVWKISTDGYHANQRTSCGTNASGGPGTLIAAGVQGQTDWTIQGGQITGASILLNFADYNAPNKQSIDVQSLLLHELGHVLGLLHSCNGSSGTLVDATTAPACFSGGVLNVPADYANAVMFPFLQVDQLRRELTQNDYNRINCLY